MWTFEFVQLADSQHGSDQRGSHSGNRGLYEPEQARGKTVDRRADVWAFGAVLYEMLTGKQAFHGEDVTEILAAVVMKEPSFEALPGKTPGPIRNLLRRCLEKNQKRRLQHIGEARIVLEDALAGATDPEPLPAAQNQRVFSWTAAGVIAVLVLALATVSFVHFRETPAQRPRLRFLMATPEKLVISMFSLSPDGGSVVFVAGEGEQNRLWIAHSIRSRHRSCPERKAQPIRFGLQTANSLDSSPREG